MNVPNHFYDNVITQMIKHKIKEAEYVSGGFGPDLTIKMDHIDQARDLIKANGDFKVGLSEPKEYYATAWLGQNTDSCPMRAEDFEPNIPVGEELLILAK